MVQERPESTDSGTLLQAEGLVTDETADQEEEIQEGTDPSILFADSNEHTLEFVYKDKKWSYHSRDMTWGEKNDCIDAAQIWTNGEFKFSISKYYVMALQKMLTRSPIRPITETTLARLNRDIGETLTSIVPNPMEEGEVEAVKKV